METEKTDFKPIEMKMKTKREQRIAVNEMQTDHSGNRTKK